MENNELMTTEVEEVNETETVEEESNAGAIATIAGLIGAGFAIGMAARPLADKAVTGVKSLVSKIKKPKKKDKTEIVDVECVPVVEKKSEEPVSDEENED